MKTDKKGFTVIEIMLVVVVIGMMAAIGIPYILGAYVQAQQNTINRNLADINKTKAQLTLPVGVAGGEGYTDATAVDDTVKGKINALLRIESADALAVGGITPDYGATIGDPAKYTSAPK